MASRPRSRVTAGVLLTRTTAGEPEYAVVHRPRYDDWTWPKGGVEAGEHLTQTAAREAREETGHAVTLGRRLPKTSYDHAGGTTQVHWWTATLRDPAAPAGPLDGHEPGLAEPEVDEVRWVAAAGAAGLLSYPADRELLAGFATRPTTHQRVLLVRHASAGDRSLWRGADAKRPLDTIGRARAARLAVILPLFAPTQIRSASPVRCRETVEQLAATLGQPVTLDRRFDDATWNRGPKPASRAMQALARGDGATDGVSVVCSQGETIPGVIAELFEGRATKAARSDIRRASNGSGSRRTPRSRKGSFWVLSFTDGELIAADYLAD